MEVVIFAVGLLTGVAICGGSLYAGYRFGWTGRDSLGVVAGETHVAQESPEHGSGRSFDELGNEDKPAE